MAAAETAVLDARSDVELTHKDFDTAAEIAVGAVGRYIEERLERTRLHGAAPGRSDAEQKLLSALFEAAGTTETASDTPLGASGARSVAAGAFRSSADIGVYLRWFNLFTLYRHALVDRLVSDTTHQGLTPVLLSPATVDFDHWLNESVDRSPLAAQIEVMDRIARRSKAPAVHGYFGFDPLREIYFREHVGGEKAARLRSLAPLLRIMGFWE